MQCMPAFRLGVHRTRGQDTCARSTFSADSGRLTAKALLQTALRDYHTDTFSVTTDDDAWYVLMEESTKVSSSLHCHNQDIMPCCH